MISLQLITDQKRESLYELRASAWRGRLTPAEFAERNRRLYRHPFGKDRIQTFALIDEENSVLTSMDSLQVKLAIQDKVVDAILIASVITPPSLRGRGYATKMLDLFLSQQKISAAVLHSDVGPKFYERWGFHQAKVWTKEVPTLSNVQPDLQAVTAEAFCDFLNGYRRELRDSSATFYAEPVWWDWIAEPHRFFAKLKKQAFPTDLFWRNGRCCEGHCLAAFPDYVSSRLDGMWIAPDCTPCQNLLHGLAHNFKLSTVRYWQKTEISSKEECPMLFLSGVKAAHWGDPQLGDWW